MGKVTTLNFFAAIPGRATLDKELTALHFRVLMVIAGRDRMSRNGQYCWESSTKLADRIGCNAKCFSSAVSELESMGYLETQKSENDKRKRGVRVVYDLEEDAVGIGVDLEKCRSRQASHSSRERLPDGNQSRVSRLPDSNHSRVMKQEEDQQYQHDKEIRPKPNILGINQYNTHKCRPGSGKTGPARYRDPDAEIARRFGNNGWEVLQAIDDETLRYLKRQLWKGTLDDKDLRSAVLEVRRVASG